MTKKTEEEVEIPFWAKIIFMPLIVGFVLFFTKISRLFNIIGSALLIFGSLALLIYFYKFCKTNQEKIRGIFKKKKGGKIKSFQELELEIDSLQKEIKDIGKRKKAEVKRKQLEEKLKKLHNLGEKRK